MGVRDVLGRPGFRDLVLVVGVGVGAAGVALQCTPPQPPATEVVDRVVDGDTLVMATGVTIRVAGVDTAESRRSAARSTPQCVAGGLADEASRRVVDMINAARGRVVLDEVDTDRYGRVVAWVEAGGVDVSTELARAGLAVPFYLPDGDPRSVEVVAAARKQAIQGAGVWSPYACPPEFIDAARETLR